MTKKENTDAYIIELNVEGRFPRNFDDLVKVALKEENAAEKTEYEDWLRSLPSKETNFFYDVVQGIRLESRLKGILTAEEFSRQSKAKADYRYRQLLQLIEPDEEKAPDFASDVAALDSILLSAKRNGKAQR